MGKLFDLDSPLMQGLTKMADLMILNLLTILCCIPIVTIGASLTAAHYVALKMHRNEEGYISKEFFKSFRQNLKQSTAIWLLVMLAIAILAGDYFILTGSNADQVQYWMQIAITVVAILAAFTITWVFPLQAKFENTVGRTMKNAMVLSILQLPKTILMLVLYAIPVVLFVFSMRSLPIVLLFGFSVPIYVSAMLYNKPFKKLEDQILGNGVEGQAEEEDDGEKIFSDTPIEEDES